MKGVLLENCTWLEAEALLNENTLMVIPLGASSKEHGPHLKLNNDLVMAEYFKRQLMQLAEVVIAPTIGYHFYPAFTEYPGSISLRLETARDLVIDICQSLAKYGPRRFYVLNTGVSTLRALLPAAAQLAQEGVLLHYTDIDRVTLPEQKITQQEGGTHADEVETSMMLKIAPDSVDMAKAVKDFHPGSGGLTRNPEGTGAFSASGVFGDATLATREKGEVFVRARLTEILQDIEELRAGPLPDRR
jgi:creatinine amidohydrolase